MFKPKQQRQEEPPKNMRLPQEMQQPNMKLVRTMFDECERRRSTTIELPYAQGGRSFLLMVLWEKGADLPIWTLYDEAGGDNSMLFSQGFSPSELDFVLEMIIMSTGQGAGAAAGAPGFIPEELRPTADSLAAQQEEGKKPDDIWKQRVSDSLSRNTQSGMPSQSSVYPDPLPRPEQHAAPPPPPPPPPVPPMPQQMPPHMAPPAPAQPAYPPNYPPPGMAPGGYPGMPPQPGYPPQPAYPPPQPAYPPQMQPGMAPGAYPGMPPAPGYPQQQFPGAQQPGWPQPQAAPPAPPAPASGPAPMPIDMGLISKRTDVTLNNLLLESGLLNSQSLDAAIRMQDLVEEKQISSRDAARVLAKYHSKGKTIEQFVSQAMQELADGARPGAGGGGGAPGGQQGQQMVSVKDALDLLVRAGVLTDNDIQTANEVRKKHGGDITKILGAANKLDEKTFEASITCVQLLRDNIMKLEQISIALQYCSRMRTSFDDACTEMNWPNPRKR